MKTENEKKVQSTENKETGASESGLSRRDFLKTGSLATAGVLAGLSVVPSSVLGKAAGKVSPSDKLNIVGVGVGGRGFGVLKEMENENIIALADVDWDYSKSCFSHFDKAKKFYDYREMFDKMGKDIDAVMIATADHTHATIAAQAITMGKHIYCEKPLTHSVYESRLLTKLAKKYGVVTQMGNQGASHPGVKQVCEWIWNGEIGEVRSVDTFTDRPIWPQGLPVPTDKHNIPSTLNWDLFTGPAKMRDFNTIYTHWNWRGWWDYGTGALGDMACHMFHPVFKGLNLMYPTHVQGTSTLLLNDCAPHAQKIQYTFPARDNLAKVAMPEVTVDWYDGGIQPLRPKGLPEKYDLNNEGGGCIFYGSKDTLICGCYGREPFLLSGRKPSVPERLRTVTLSHELDFVRACKEEVANRVLTTSDFSEAGPLNEMVVMGVLSVRLQGLQKVLDWNGEKMEFTNINANEEIRMVLSDGFSIKDGHPTFDKKWTDPVNAQTFAKELVKHTYRNGWSLPDMPK